MNTNSNDRLTGVIFASIAYILWGFLPIYWKLLKQVPAVEIIAHRILWSCAFVVVLILFLRQWDKIIIALKNSKNLILIMLCSILVTINWFTYIWAVNSNHIVETSMGYYISPLISVFFGMTVLKEKLSAYKYVSIILASIGVILITVQYGKVPWIALALAISFGIYGLLKKLIVVESIIGLALETAILVPFALVFIALRQSEGTDAFGTASIPIILLLLGAGVVTAIPLLLFAKATKSVDLSTIGFLQYITPSINLIIGIFVFRESFTGTHFITFGFIWTALLIYTLSQTGLIRFKQKIVDGA